MPFPSAPLQFFPSEETEAAEERMRVKMASFGCGLEVIRRVDGDEEDMVVKCYAVKSGGHGEGVMEELGNWSVWKERMGRVGEEGRGAGVGGVGG